MRRRWSRPGSGSGSRTALPGLAFPVRLELHRDAVHAVTQPGRLRAVFEHVAKMPLAARAVHLGAAHEPASVGRGFDRAIDRRPEAWPSGAALELGVGA